MSSIGYPFFPFGRKGGNIPMEFLFELLKEFVKAIVREVSAYVFRKQILEKDNKKPTLLLPRRRRKQKGGFRKK
ncbi:hypothetical protein CN271_29840 [Bacillus cereus]|nr:hypothetical protein CON59_26390 [Bacillus cereus]PET38794.1 hypothetical protein CN523_25775 [Bacillus cereus]PEV79306.1 hypothetical protein CN429_17760 [Bacillus cereus]PFA40945.1 hypothetical protein CN389_29915 [Bacillus cereus]PFD58918.1 hypothetical protein CN271_29840 [Bacillus cereus]